MCEKVVKVSFETSLFENPVSVLSRIVSSFLLELSSCWPHGSVSEWLLDSWDEMVKFSFFSLQDLKHVLYIAVAVTVIRALLDFTILRGIPKWFKMDSGAAGKFRENVFELLFYSITWLWELRVIVWNPNNLFVDLGSHFRNWTLGGPIESDIYWLYMVQLGMYLHFILATIFVNARKKDYNVLLVHHFLTIALLSWSYAIRYHYIGVVVVFLHDIGDVLLLSGKTLLCFSELNGKKYKAVNMLANTVFGGFVIQWVVFRLYWFITKALYSSGHISLLTCTNVSFYLPFNAMLFALYLMQVYWFFFIVKLLIKVLSGEDACDNREYPDEQQNGSTSQKKDQ